MRTFGLIGYPLGHSFSRAFFTDKFAAESIDAQYLNFEIADIALLPVVIDSEPTLCGLNVTIPYKQAVIPFLDSLDPAAAEIGAVNVIKFKQGEDGRTELIGYNSDVIGFCDSLRPMLRASHRRALILGSGGASKAVFHGLLSLGIEPVTVSRTPKPGQLAYSDLTPEVMATHTVIVNTTPLGMHPRVDDAPPIPYSLLTPEHICFDLVYNPAVTKFLALAAERGAATKNGLEMLHGQAIAAWNIWNA